MCARIHDYENGDYAQWIMWHGSTCSNEMPLPAWKRAEELAQARARRNCDPSFRLQAPPLQHTHCSCRTCLYLATTHAHMHHGYSCTHCAPCSARGPPWSGAHALSWRWRPPCCVRLHPAHSACTMHLRMHIHARGPMGATSGCLRGAGRSNLRPSRHEGYGFWHYAL